MVKILSLRLINFRNYNDVSCSFCPDVNVIEGPNGHGKTNLLEALFFLSFGRSFRTHHLQEVSARGSQNFVIVATFVRDGVEEQLKILFSEGKRQIIHNDTIYRTFTPLLGLCPSVLSTPSDIDLIMGPPQTRRRFLNLHLSQIDRQYGHHLTRYTKALKQRNALLRQRKNQSIEIWEDQMSISADYLTTRRKVLLDSLISSVQPYYHDLLTEKDLIELEYIPSIKADFSIHWEKSRPKEQEIGTTLYGPHRDDWVILRNRENAKIFSSEGQKRSIITAIKLAEFALLRELSHTVPIMYIDDFGVHLDAQRIDLLKNQLTKMGQVFITTPIAHDVSGLRIQIEHGALLNSQYAE